MKLRAAIRRIKAWGRNNLSILIVALLIVLFVVVYFWHSIFITIHAGEGGVLYRRFFGGVVVDKVYAEGFHVIMPWDTMTAYNVRYQAIHHEMYALSQKGMRIKIHLTIRYAPEYRLLGVLHQNVGPDYADKIVIPEAEAVIRKIVGQFTAEEVYSTKRAIIQKIVDEAVEQMSQRYVRIDDMIITQVELPETIRKAIEAKLEQREKAAAYEFILEKEKKEAERKKIEAGGYQVYNRTVDSSLSDRILQWRGIQATEALAKSNNAKVVVIGSGKDGLPIILNADSLGVPSGNTEPQAAATEPTPSQAPAAADGGDTPSATDTDATGSSGETSDGR